jgi:hypothetical protein
MENLKIKINPEVELVLDNYPLRNKMLTLRELIIETFANNVYKK